MNRRVRIFLFAAGGVLLVMGGVVAFLVIRFQPIARDYVISTLRERYNSEISLENLQISLFPTVRATGENLVFRFAKRQDPVPLVKIRRFTLEARFIGFFRNPKRIRLLRIEGLEIHTPPKSSQAAARPAGAVKVPFVLEEVIANGTTLQTMPRDPGKDPLVFDIRELTLHSVGIGQPMTFHAALTNPKPPGLIHSDGQFGPWDRDEPADTPLSGRYAFRDADLSVFKGIGGTLYSDGTYKGQLSRIEVRGTADVPNFSLKLAGHAVPLHTDFQATVDGTDGDTILHPVRARLGKAEFEVSGSIDRSALETHKTIALDAKSSGAPLDDFLRLAIKAGKPPMSGEIRFNTKVKIPPGETEVVDRLQLDGDFGIRGVKFTSADVQQKIADLSHRAQGDPKNEDPNVAAQFEGRFRLFDGRLTLPALRFELPGADVRMAGAYTLRSGDLDFTGTARMDSTISGMTTGIKRILLKPVDPLFRRNGAGAVLPIRISGTRGQPSFKLDIGRVLKRK